MKEQLLQQTLFNWRPPRALSQANKTVSPHLHPPKQSRTMKHDLHLSSRFGKTHPLSRRWLAIVRETLRFQLLLFSDVFLTWDAADLNSHLRECLNYNTNWRLPLQSGFFVVQKKVANRSKKEDRWQLEKGWTCEDKSWFRAIVLDVTLFWWKWMATSETVN